MTTPQPRYQIGELAINTLGTGHPAKVVKRQWVRAPTLAMSTKGFGRIKPGWYYHLDDDSVINGWPVMTYEDFIKPIPPDVIAAVDEAIRRAGEGVMVA